jgi:hypothetical protein
MQNSLLLPELFELMNQHRQPHAAGSSYDMQRLEEAKICLTARASRLFGDKDTQITLREIPAKTKTN